MPTLFSMANNSKSPLDHRHLLPNSSRHIEDGFFFQRSSKQLTFTSTVPNILFCYHGNVINKLTRCKNGKRQIYYSNYFIWNHHSIVQESSQPRNSLFFLYPMANTKKNFELLSALITQISLKLDKNVTPCNHKHHRNA